MVTRVVTGAHYGLKDWLIQRVSAVVMATYVVLFVAAMLVCTPANYEEWRDVFAPQWMRLATLLFFLSLFWHAWIGMRDILMDYVSSAAARLGLQVVVVLLLVAYAAWAVQILWSI
ncbi:MAG TPA: succinate dehydrogenase, hydrophobic membrane anchor protein [Burkholderiales bacterium]|nr:succinate dehydrogenase, hydrophobic membrane anchor protein [Burkholderiales bacterium]